MRWPYPFAHPMKLWYNTRTMFEDNIFGRLDARIQKAVAEAGYSRPTPIQEKAIAPILDGRDLIGVAQTGTGKTAAFMLPILDRLAKVRRPRTTGRPRALVLSPTRELAAQTAENVKLYSKYTALPFACVFGGVSQFHQVKDIRRGAETLVACPGRLIDLMTQGIIFLDKIECVVLDEADRMLDMGFLPDIKRILSKLPRRRQSLFFSATMPKNVRSLACEFVTDPVEITVAPESPTVDKINQSVMFVEKSDKDALLVHLLETHPEWTKTIVFTKMRHGADRIVKKLLRAKIECAAIHSDKTQNQRTRALDGFKRGKTRVLVATDIASRGIDVPEVSAVVNMELPLETENYVHRIGRTARAGESGTAVSFVSAAERSQLKAVERLIKKSIRVDNSHPFHGKAPEAAPWERKPAGTGGETGDGRPARRRPDRKKNFKKRKSFLGARQKDFGKKIFD